MPSQLKNVVFGVKIMDEPYFSQVTDIFGVRAWRIKKHGGSGMHAGIDLGCPIGTPIHSPYKATVVQVSKNVAKAGNIVKLKHADGFETRYLHLDKIFVEQDQEIPANFVFAYSGNSDGGTTRSTGPHLHFEVHVNGEKVDPAPYLYGYALKDGKGGKWAHVPATSFQSKSAPDEAAIRKLFSSNQLKHASIIVDKCKELGGGRRDAIIAIMTALQESRLENLNRGDRDSQGLFQQRPSMGWGTVAQITTPEYAAKAFLTGTSAGNKGLLDYKNRDRLSLTEACQQVQRSGFPDAYAKWEEKATKIVDFFWGTIVESYLDEYATERIGDKQEEVEINDKLASGIWQIVKVVIDPEVKDLQINDSTISMHQGSLFSYFEKVCQKPFVEFWGDTYGDQYYFIIRKPPFTRESFLSLAVKGFEGGKITNGSPRITIEENEVFSDNFIWENEEVYSWFKIDPNGNYIGGYDPLYAPITAVYFEEYAEIWGSRPLNVVTNYITFIKKTGDVMMKEATKQLKWITDIYSYLPFTRKGTITIYGDRRIKKGMVIYYAPTDEYFYVDSVSNNFSANNGILDRTTTLQVSRGMVRAWAEQDIKTKHSKSYFNLINYGPGSYSDPAPEDVPKAKPKEQNPNIQKTLAFFNQDKDIFPDVKKDKGYVWQVEGKGLNINKGDLFLDVGTPEPVLTKSATGSFTKNELKLNKKVTMANYIACSDAAKLMKQYPNLSFELVGNTDEVMPSNYNIDLGRRRAETVRQIILYYYRDYYKPVGSENGELEGRLQIRTDGEENPESDNKTPIGRLRNRRVDWYIKGELDKLKGIKPKEPKPEPDAANDVKWSVNKDVFKFFLTRQQFGEQVIDEQ
jgi:outer membrane protein OmpA-like peptidoglycan-associated protein